MEPYSIVIKKLQQLRKRMDKQVSRLEEMSGKFKGKIKKTTERKIREEIKKLEKVKADIDALIDKLTFFK